MKLTVKVSKAFKKLKNAEKPPFGANVINGLDNSIFANPPVALTQLQLINNQLTAALANAQMGNHSFIAAVKPLITEWESVFSRTADFVSGVAEGSESIIRLAGFVPTKSESTPSQKPGAVTAFKATINGSKGAIIAGSQFAVPGGDAYLFCATPEGATVTHNGDITIITIGENSIYLTACKTRQTEMYDLPSGIPYNVSMYAINSAGSGPASQSQQVIPQ